MDTSIRFLNRFIGKRSRGVLRMGMAAILVSSASTQASVACTQLVSVSQSGTAALVDQPTLNRHLKQFCRGYASEKAGIKSPSFDLSFRFIAEALNRLPKASALPVDTSVPALVGRFCDRKTDSGVSDYAYQDYLATVSTAAPTLYQQCGAMEQSGLFIRIEPASFLPNNMTLLISNQTGNEEAAELQAAGSSEVACHWLSGSVSLSRLPEGKGTILDCTRQDPSRAGYVRLIYLNGGDLQTLTVPWSSMRGHQKRAVETVDKNTDTAPHSKTDAKNTNKETAKPKTNGANKSDEVITPMQVVPIQVGRPAASEKTMQKQTVLDSKPATPESPRVEKDESREDSQPESQNQEGSDATFVP
ncbi:Uncharacterised protein [BD1-7 clade bacterium]|uniref:Uncharacterized protein n=1 Tax=BD1-7 clade bacterium TaxID=2029982 RepID=A0A5S9QRU6_9GAMM|nr:Uncharacterised protein [BD1-7 clade bacterium]